MTQIPIPNLESLTQAAQKFLEVLDKRKVVAFYAEMGTGKTTFIAALARRLGVRDAINSPTFAILNEYRDAEGAPVYHFDFYRLRSSAEAVDLGFEDYFYSGQLCLIEWPEIVEDILPDDCVKAHITTGADGSRLLTVE